MRRRLQWIAFFFHAPGLWLLARTPLPKAARVENLWAVGATLAAMASAWWLGGAWYVHATVATWVVGHLLWGARLAHHVGASTDVREAEEFRVPRAVGR